MRNGAPFADMPEPLQRLRGLLLKREGCDRVMDKVLAVVPKHGLEAALVAVELVLESGNFSVEHIENVTECTGVELFLTRETDHSVFLILRKLTESRISYAATEKIPWKTAKVGD